MFSLCTNNAAPCIRSSLEKGIQTHLTFPPGPDSQPNSSQTLVARLTAEILRGCVQTILHFFDPSSSNKSSNKKCGTWVLFPLPVSPATTTIRCFLRVSTIEFRCLNTGNSCLSFKSLWYLGELCSFLNKILEGSKLSVSEVSKERLLGSSSETRFSQESSGPSDTFGCFSDCSCCCCLSLFNNRAIKLSRGLLVSILFSSSFFFSISLHSSQTSL